MSADLPIFPPISSARAPPLVIRTIDARSARPVRPATAAPAPAGQRRAAYSFGAGTPISAHVSFAGP